MPEHVAFCAARAGLLGNPSDGYGGFVVSLTVANWRAGAAISAAGGLAAGGGLSGEEAISVQVGDWRQSWRSRDGFLESLARSGHPPEGRIATAALQRWWQFAGHGLARPGGFHLRVWSDIPLQVGLGGSSAIVIAVMRALGAWSGVALEPALLASLALSAETDLLGIPAGLQDRVCQSLEGLVAMDFSAEAMRTVRGLRVGRYWRLDPARLPARLFVAWSRRGREATEVPHRSLRQRFEAGDRAVVDAMVEFARLGRRGVEALERGDEGELGRLLDAAFDLRRSVSALNPVHVSMVETVRRIGGHAQYCGSGGAIVGLRPAGMPMEELAAALAAEDCQVVVPDCRTRLAEAGGAASRS